MGMAIAPLFVNRFSILKLYMRAKIHIYLQEVKKIISYHSLSMQNLQLNTKNFQSQITLIKLKVKYKV